MGERRLEEGVDGTARREQLRERDVAGAGERRAGQTRAPTVLVHQEEAGRSRPWRASAASGRPRRRLRGKIHREKRFRERNRQTNRLLAVDYVLSHSRHDVVVTFHNSFLISCVGPPFRINCCFHLSQPRILFLQAHHPRLFRTSDPDHRYAVLH